MEKSTNRKLEIATKPSFLFTQISCLQNYIDVNTTVSQSNQSRPARKTFEAHKRIKNKWSHVTQTSGITLLLN